MNQWTGPRPLADRFWEKVQKSDGCWLWTGSTSGKGYGQLTAPKGIAPYRAHRLSWEWHVGPIPKGMFVCHNCDTNYPVGDITSRRCVRPDHLFLGTNAENIKDARAKNRMHPGERSHSARLTTEQVAEIRRRYAESPVSSRVFAEEFGVNRRTISALLSGRSWRTD